MSTQESRDQRSELRAISAESQVQYALEQDRESLQHKHNSERSRARAMATLAASAAPMQESGNSSALISKLWNSKALLGSFVALVGGGSILLGVLLSSDSSPQAKEMSQTGSSIVVEEVLDVSIEPDPSITTPHPSSEEIESKAEPHVKSMQSGRQSILKYDVVEKEEKELTSENLSEKKPLSVSEAEESDQTEVTAPEVHRKGSLNLNVTVNPVQTTEED